MNSFALIGYPLGHSLSPVIHRELFKIKNTNAEYDLKEIKPEELDENFKNLKNLCGFNVTIPHKTKIIQNLDKLDSKAELFGSVNTVKCGDIVTGYNTDCVGFLRSLDMANIELKGNVLVCGAGGVSRMFVFESVLKGCNVTVAVREKSLDSANKIKAEIKEKLNKDINVVKYDDIENEFDLIINGTPVGMYPNTNACVIKKEIVEKSKAVFDAIYNPEETLLLKYAKDAGIKYLNGLPMLVWQAAVAEEIWLDVNFTLDDIEKVIEIAKKELKK